MGSNVNVLLVTLLVTLLVRLRRWLSRSAATRSLGGGVAAQTLDLPKPCRPRPTDQENSKADRSNQAPEDGGDFNQLLNIDLYTADFHGRGAH